MKDPDFVKRAITKHLKPALADAGFYRIRPRKFVRLRGDLVDVIAFQMSQWGGRDRARSASGPRQGERHLPAHRVRDGAPLGQLAFNFAPEDRDPPGHGCPTILI